MSQDATTNSVTIIPSTPRKTATSKKSADSKKSASPAKPSAVKKSKNTPPAKKSSKSSKSSKKSTPKSTRGAKDVLSPTEIKGAIAAWKSGQSIRSIALELDLPSGRPLKRAIVQHLGGKTAFFALRNKGAGPRGGAKPKTIKSKKPVKRSK